MWRIWWAPNNASRWQMGFNLAFKELNMFYLVIYWTQKVHNDFIFLCSIVLPPVGHSWNHQYHCCQLKRQSGPPSLHYYCAVVLHSCIVLPPVGHSSNHQYHCCQLTRQAEPPSLHYYCAVMLHFCTVLPPVGHSSNHQYHCCQLTRQAEPPSLHYYCAVVLHSCIVLPPVGHSSNHKYHCCQRTRQSSCVSNFYRTFKVFVWLSLVLRFYSGFALNVLLFGDCLPHTGNYDAWFVFVRCWWLHFVLCACGRSVFRKHSEIDVCCVRYFRCNCLLCMY